jgi:hypothetical protein
MQRRLEQPNRATRRQTAACQISIDSFAKLSSIAVVLPFQNIRSAGGNTNLTIPLQ